MAICAQFCVKRNRLGAKSAKEFSRVRFFCLEMILLAAVFDPFVKATLLKKVASGDASTVKCREVSTVFESEYKAWATTCETGIFRTKYLLV
jgi:hypothetical protein